MKKYRLHHIKQISVTLALLLSVILCGCSSAGKGVNGQVIVYNWGEYIDPETIRMFEEESGIKVIYDEFETNESMYPKVESGAVAYDIACPSDYMISRMIQNGMLSELDYAKMPNARKNIGAQYFEQSRGFDPDNKYAIPYCWGTVGILYNKTMVEEPITRWEQLWDEKYADNILMHIFHPPTCYSVFSSQNPAVIRLLSARRLFTPHLRKQKKNTFHPLDKDAALSLMRHRGFEPRTT